MISKHKSKQNYGLMASSATISDADIAVSVPNELNRDDDEEFCNNDTQRDVFLQESTRTFPRRRGGARERLHLNKYDDTRSCVTSKQPPNAATITTSGKKNDKKEDRSPRPMLKSSDHHHKNETHRKTEDANDKRAKCPASLTKISSRKKRSPRNILRKTKATDNSLQNDNIAHIGQNDRHESFVQFEVYPSG